MADVVKNNFVTKFKIQRKAKSLKKEFFFKGREKEYSSVHSLINEIKTSNLLEFDREKSLLEFPSVIRILNEASEHFVSINEYDKAYECFSCSLSLRNRQRESIDNEISRQIELWNPGKILDLAEKGYDAYKHTRYLVVQSFVQLLLSADKTDEISAETKEIINNYATSGKLKGFYRYYLNNKIYTNVGDASLIYTVARRGLRDPLIQKTIANIFIRAESLQIKPCSNFVDLYIAIMVDHGHLYPDLKPSFLFQYTDSLDESDSRTIIIALKHIDHGVEFHELETLFYKLKKASSRYQLIRLMKGTKDERWIYQLVQNACKWKSPTFIARILKLLFDDKKYELIVELYKQLPVSHQQHKQIFTFHIGALRNTDNLDLAKKLLQTPSESVPEINIFTQLFYIHKKEKVFTLALEKARQVYDLQAPKNRQRWAMAIVELMAAEGDFESAYQYIQQHPEYTDALLPLFHFREGTLAKIEQNLKTRILAGEVNDTLHYYISYLHCERKEYPEAIEQIKAAIAIKINRRNALHYVLLKTVVEKDFEACLDLISSEHLDADLLFAKYYAYSLIQLERLDETEEYLRSRADVFNVTEKGRNERLLLLANTSRLKGDYSKSFDLFSSMFPEDQRCFTSKDTATKSFAVMNLKSTAKKVIDDSQPLISVIMTNFGWTEYTPVAIQSILDQSHSNFELIIVDDRSEANAYRKLAKFVRHKKDKRIKLIRLKQNSGTYRAKNNGLKIAKGDYITFQDSDDWSHPNRLSIQLDKLKDKKVLALVVNYCRVDDFGIVNLHNGNIMRKGPITLFYKRKVLDTLGYFDSVRTSADSEYLGRVAAHFGHDALLHHEAPYYIVPVRKP